jgi:hypothetical protein
MSYCVEPVVERPRTGATQGAAFLRTGFCDTEDGGAGMVGGMWAEQWLLSAGFSLCHLFRLVVLTLSPNLRHAPTCLLSRAAGPIACITGCTARSYKPLWCNPPNMMPNILCLDGSRPPPRAICFSFADVLDLPPSFSRDLVFLRNWFRLRQLKVFLSSGQDSARLVRGHRRLQQSNSDIIFVTAGNDAAV